MLVVLAIVCDTVCFNRYMVECEYIMAAAIEMRRRVLIDTWWNVNV